MSNILLKGSPDGNQYQSKSILILEPLITDKPILFRTVRGLTIERIDTVVGGTGSPSVTWDLKYATDTTTAGTSILNGVETNTTVGTSATTMTNQTVPSDDWIWLEISATGGTSVTQFSLSLDYIE
jgi:hypothetical protein